MPARNSVHTDALWVRVDAGILHRFFKSTDDQNPEVMAVQGDCERVQVAYTYFVTTSCRRIPVYFIFIEAEDI